MPNLPSKLEKNYYSYVKGLAFYVVIIAACTLFTQQAPNYLLHGAILPLTLAYYHYKRGNIIMAHHDESTKTANSTQKLREKQFDEIASITYRCVVLNDISGNSRKYLSVVEVMSLQALHTRILEYLYVLGQTNLHTIKAGKIEESIATLTALETAVADRKEAERVKTADSYGGDDVQILIERAKSVPNFLTSSVNVQRRVLKPYAEDIVKQRLTTRSEEKLIEAAEAYLKEKREAA